MDEDLGARLVACLAARLDSILDSNLDTILDRMLDSSLDSILDANVVTGVGTGGGNFRMDLGYVGGVDRELILGRDLDLVLDWFGSDPKVIASLGIEDMEKRFNLPPVENPGYHLLYHCRNCQNCQRHRRCRQHHRQQHWWPAC